MIPCQRHLFDIPDDVAYLNCAYLSPIMKHVAQAGAHGTARKMQPWRITPADFFTEASKCRALFARLVNTQARNVAFVPSASYGIAVAARNLPLQSGREVVLLEDQFPSNYYAWSEAARARDAKLRVVAWDEARLDNGGIDWTEAVLAAIGPNTAIVTLPHCHWTDGSLLDLVSIGQATRDVGAALVLDITQSGGALPFDVQAIQPDFAVCAAYKWLLGPYAIGFLYVDPKWHDGEPLEHNWIAREGAENFSGLVEYVDGFEDGAVRFDMGERASFHLMPMAAAALEQILDWGVDNISATLAKRTSAVAERASALGFSSAPPSARAGHFLGLRSSSGLPDGITRELAGRNVHVSVRGSSLRVTPHLYNTDQDVDRLFDALEELT